MQHCASQKGIVYKSFIPHCPPGPNLVLSMTIILPGPNRKEDVPLPRLTSNEPIRNWTEWQTCPVLVSMRNTEDITIHVLYILNIFLYTIFTYYISIYHVYILSYVYIHTYVYILLHTLYTYNYIHTVYIYISH